MRGWLRNAWGFVKGLPRDTSTYLHRIIGAVIGWATNIFHIVGAAWNDLAKAYHDLSVLIGSFMDSVFAHVAKIVTHTIPDLARALVHDITKVASDVATLTREAAKWVDDAIHKAEAEVTGALDWVKHNVLEPLSKDLHGALEWIERTGAQMWHLIHDGEYIAALAFKWIWGELLNLLHSYAKTVLRWIIGNGLTFGVRVARIIEDALTEVL